VSLHVEKSSSNVILATCMYKPTTTKFLLACVYGDPYHRRTRAIWREVRSFVIQYPNVPAICMGDLNNVMHSNEKFGPRPINVARISTFCWLVKDCGLVDLGFSGLAYTWCNKHFNTNPTFERLDRSLGNAEWCAAFPSTSVFHLPMMISDHSPILTVLQSSRAKPRKPFRFENWWLMEGDFQREASSSWAKSAARSFDLKTKYLASDLLKWIRKKPSICSQLEVIEKSINQISQPAQQDHGLEKHLIQQHHNILEKQEEFHKQRFKKLWTLEGDRNTHFFQQAILKRARRNRIVYLTNDQGQPLTTHD